MATADTVIVYDSDWNPQSDFQAIDRVHRIGQKKQVHIFRLITENTIDQRIVQRAEIKQRLDKIVIHHGNKQTKDEPKGNLIEDIKSGMKEMMSKDANKHEADYDLEKILKDSAVKAAAEKMKLDKMTLEDISGTSVYHFEGSDCRAGPSQSN